MKGYETAFDICEKVNEDEKIQENKLLIYASSWREDFLSITIKDFEEYDDNVKYACEKVKEQLLNYDDWKLIKEEFDEKTRQVEIQAIQK